MTLTAEDQTGPPWPTIKGLRIGCVVESVTDIGGGLVEVRSRNVASDVGFLRTVAWEDAPRVGAEIEIEVS